MTTTTENHSTQSGSRPPSAQALFTTAMVWPAVTGGFLTAAAMWVVWFITHLPGLNVPASASGGVLLATMLAATAMTGSWAGRRLGARIGLGAGLCASVINLLILGAFLVEPAASEDVRAAEDAVARPGAPLLAAGFVVLGAVAGTVGGSLGGILIGSARSIGLDPRRWLTRFGWIGAGTTLPLILLGGLVTSTESGLAVPDWPGSYGANMFLYPIALMADPRIFLEHTHRLFGSLVGLTTLVLTLNVLVVDRRAWVKGWAIALFVLVVTQGVMGGVRVVAQSPMAGLAHGVTGQLFFALMVAQAWWLGSTWLDAEPGSLARLRRIKRFSTGFLHVTVLQLLMGAAFRHLSAAEMKGADHALWTHAGFSLIVVIFAALSAAAAMGDPPQGDARRKVFSGLGRGIVASVFIQFALGWVALFAVLQGTDRGPVPTAERLDQAQPVPLGEVIVATIHQANGALVLALAMSVYVWSLRKGTLDPSTAARPAESSPATGARQSS